MTPTIDDINAVIRSWIVSVSGLSDSRVIFRNQDGVRLGANSADIYLVSFVQVEQNVSVPIAPEDANDSENAYANSYGLATYSINVWGDSAFDYINKIQSRLNSVDETASLRRAQVSTVTVTATGKGTYSVLIDGNRLIYNEHVGDTTAKIATGLATAIDDALSDRVIGLSAAAALNVVTVTAEPGIEFDAAAGSLGLTVATTTRAVDAAMVEIAGLANLTTLLGERNENGYALDVVFGVHFRRSESMTFIETVEAEDEATGETIIVETE